MAAFIAAGILERHGHDLFDVVSLIALPAAVAFALAFRTQLHRQNVYLADLEKQILGEEDERRWRAYVWRVRAAQTHPEAGVEDSPSNSSARR